MLAPRALHFTSTQIFWDCPTQSACESLPGGLPRELDYGASVDRKWRARLQRPLEASAGSDADANTAIGPRITSRHEIPYEFWKIAVRGYTSCALTFHSDKLKALEGITQLVQDSRGGERFVAGLWERFLVLQLAWAVEDPAASQRPEPDEKNWFPSWSWASVTGKVEIVDRKLLNMIYTASVDDGLDVVSARGSKGLSEMGQGEAIINLRGYPAKGFMVDQGAGTGWVLKVPDNSQTSVAIPAFPDVFPSEKNGLLGPCELVVLAVGEKRLGLQEDGTVIYDSDNLRHVYSGVGLLIRKGNDIEGSSVFQPVGMIKFTEMGREN